jgi:hypothetical protein
VFCTARSNSTPLTQQCRVRGESNSDSHVTVHEVSWIVGEANLRQRLDRDHAASMTNGTFPERAAREPLVSITIILLYRGLGRAFLWCSTFYRVGSTVFATTDSSAIDTARRSWSLAANFSAWLLHTRNVIVGAVKKSMAAMASRWFRRKTSQRLVRSGSLGARFIQREMVLSESRA